MRGYLVYVLIVKNLSHRFCLNSATVGKIGRPYRGMFLGFFETFLEGSVDHVIYRDYIVNRLLFRPSFMTSKTDCQTQNGSIHVPVLATFQRQSINKLDHKLNKKLL